MSVPLAQPEISAAAPPQLDGTTLGRLIETVRYVESRTAENKVIEFLKSNAKIKTVTE